MLRVEHSVIIDKPPLEVWEFLTDLENTPKWDIGVRETRVTSEGPAGLGTTFENVGPFLGRESVREYEVTAYEPIELVTVTLRDPPGPIRSAYVSYGLSPVASGTRLTATGELAFKGFFKLLQPTLARRARRDAQGDLANLKHLLEA